MLVLFPLLPCLELTQPTFRIDLEQCANSDRYQLEVDYLHTILDQIVLDLEVTQRRKIPMKDINNRIIFEQCFNNNNNNNFSETRLYMIRRRKKDILFARIIS